MNVVLSFQERKQSSRANAIVYWIALIISLYREMWVYMFCICVWMLENWNENIAWKMWTNFFIFSKSHEIFYSLILNYYSVIFFNLFWFLYIFRESGKIESTHSQCDGMVDICYCYDLNYIYFCNRSVNFLTNFPFWLFQFIDIFVSAFISPGGVLFLLLPDSVHDYFFCCLFST